MSRRRMDVWSKPSAFRKLKREAAAKEAEKARRLVRADAAYARQWPRMAVGSVRGRVPGGCFVAANFTRF